MNVIFDHQIFCLQLYGGISRYFAALISELKAERSVTVQLPFRWVQNKHLLELGIGGLKDPFPGLRFRGKARLMDIANKIAVRRTLLKRKFDIFHPTNYDDFFLEVLDNKPLVLTAHDFIAQRLPQYFPVLDKYEANKQRLFGRASRLIAVSESTRQDAISLFGISSDKIIVVPLAAPRLSPSETFSFPVPDRYVLFVGQRYAYKNFERFTKAMAIVLAVHSDLHLVCAGGGPLKVGETKALEKFMTEGRVHWHAVDDSSLARLYIKAQAFVFPSLYEGFGIPLLESMQLGCPTVLSMRSSFPEVAGDAAVYFDPDDVGAMAEAIERVVHDRELQARLRVRGQKRERNFSWRFTAARTREVYAEVL